MSFDKDTRNALSKMVATCRRLLTEDATDQLRGRFGMYPDGTCLPLDRLKHLAEDEKAAAGALRELLEHFAASEAGQAEERRQRAYDRLVLEVSFTALNRLAALRLCEERGLVVECVRNGTTSDGFRLFERLSGGALGARHQTYRVFLESLFDELALDLGVFDRSTPQSAVFPGDRCLTEVLAELNKLELVHLWAADETIGWIYQYFNPPEERKSMRDASQAPRNSRELAVRNQFFTPRYVVEFLTDNTLGRLWYEMRKSNTDLKEKCRYLVRRPNEIFLGPGEKAPAADESVAHRSRDEVLKPVYIEHRSGKDPRDLRVLDPACGSGHFLLYGFDLLERIYEEGWEGPESSKSEISGRSLREDFQTIEGLRRAVPKLIIEHNLHGIDIDSRAVQIAALALWLRAQKAWKKLDLKASERPRIDRSNIVTAEPMPGEEDMRREFTAGLTPRVLGQLVDVVFEKMRLAGEAGSLLKIEEEIKDAVSQAKMEYQQQMSSRFHDAEYLPGMAPQRDPSLFDFTDLTEQDFWEQAEDLILSALQEYVQRADNGRVMRRRLFAEDTARGFAFINVCRRRYDVVVMNPPFGKPSVMSDRMLRSAYPENWKDLYAAFFERAISFAVRGLVAAITSSQFLYTKQLHGLRLLFIDRSALTHFVKLGPGVLDGATVDTGLSVLRLTKHNGDLVYADVSSADLDDRGALLARTGSNLLEMRLYHLEDFSHIATAPFAFHSAPGILALWRRHGRLEPDIGRVATGNHTFDDERFVRLRWEVPPWEIGRRWRTFEKGGEYQPFLSPTPFLVDWLDDGRALRHLNWERHGTDAQVMQSSKYWFKPGLCYSHVSSVAFGPRVMPGGGIFSSESIAIIPKAATDLWPLLGFLSSTLCQELIYVFGEYRKIENRAVANLPITSELLSTGGSRLADLAMKAVASMSVLESMDETSPLFVKPDGVVDGGVRECRKRATLCRQLSNICDDLDSICERMVFDDGQSIVLRAKKRSALTRTYAYRCVGGLRNTPAETLMSYCVGASLGRWDIRAGANPTHEGTAWSPFDALSICPPGLLQGTSGLPVDPSDVSDAYPLRVSFDGILVDDPGFNGGQPHRDDIVRRVREVLDLLWKDRAHEIEQEACAILGVADLRDYFRRPTGFFQDHLKRYSKSQRKAPIYWPLSTASRSYTLWLYYQRLADQTLYAVVNKYVEPKIAGVAKVATRLEKDLESASGRDAMSLRDRLHEVRTFLNELRDLREELLRVAGLPYKPNLSDGVILNAAPFHKLFRLRSWANETEQVWKKLENGDYNWAHLAYTLWPDRVRESCRTDRSIAIAHGLENLCDVPPEPVKGLGKKRDAKRQG